MTTRIIETDQDRRKLIKFIEEQKPPMTVSIKKGGKRTVRQNRLQRLWATEVADQSGESPEYVRAMFKLQVGVPILRHENEEFCEKYDRLIRPRTYEEKIELMMEPIDFPVTRLMSVEQQTRYLDEIFRKYSGEGYILTLPEDRLIEQYTGSAPSPVKGGEAVYSPQPGEVMPPQTSPGDPIDVRKWTPKEERYLKEYAKKALDDLARPNQSVGYVREIIGNMKRLYKEEMASEDAVKILQAMDAPFNAILKGTQTVPGARQYIAKDLIGCPTGQIGG